MRRLTDRVSRVCRGDLEHLGARSYTLQGGLWESIQTFGARPRHALLGNLANSRSFARSFCHESVSGKRLTSAADGYRLSKKYSRLRDLRSTSRGFNYSTNKFP